MKKTLPPLLKLLLCLGLLLYLAACAATPKEPSTGEYIDDAVITSKIKAEIFKEPTLKMLQINVETYRGVVQLSGFVDARENVKKAEEVAAGVAGVKEVKNSLLVK